MLVAGGKTFVTTMGKVKFVESAPTVVVVSRTVKGAEIETLEVQPSVNVRGVETGVSVSLSVEETSKN
jgi:hypothetical protein